MMLAFIKNFTIVSLGIIMGICGSIYANEYDKENPLINKENVALTQDLPLRFIYSFDFNFFVDNLEDSEAYWATRTLFAASLAPEIGINFYNQNIRVGGYFIANMGEKFPNPKDNGMGLSLYYDTHYKNFHGYFGIFPRKYWIGDYPNLYYRQDFTFFNPVINGMLLQYQSQAQDFNAELTLDWYGGNIQKRIDEFLVSVFTQKDFFNKKLFIGGSALLYHTKNEEILNPGSTNLDVFLLDRFYYNVFIGSDLHSLMPFMDKAYLKFGALASVERKRKHTGIDPFSHIPGAQLEIAAQYKGFGVLNTFYFGGSQYKYFNEYGESFYWGLPFYQANIYNRMEAYWQYQKDYITARFSLILHITDKAIANQQMLTISVDTQKLIDKFYKHKI